MSLVDATRDVDRRIALVSDSAAELGAELDSKRGVSAMAVRGAYRTVKKLRPGFIEENLSKMLPGFAPLLDEHHLAAAGLTRQHFTTNAAAIAEQLLEVTDRRVGSATNRAAIAVYRRMRPRAAEHVVDGMPRLAALIDRHA